MTISCSPTPNPNSLKFEAEGRSFIDSGLIAAFTPEEAAENALGVALFELTGIESLLITPTFVTVTKEPDVEWNELAGDVENALRKWLGEG